MDEECTIWVDIDIGQDSGTEAQNASATSSDINLQILVELRHLSGRMNQSKSGGEKRSPSKIQSQVQDRVQ